LSATILDVVVVTWNTRELTLRCLEALRRALARPPALAARVCVVDNGSVDGTAEAVEAAFPGFRVVRLAQNRGFAAGANAGLRGGEAEVVLLLNSDARIDREALDRVLALFEREPRVGIAGLQLVRPDGRRQSSTHRFPGPLRELVPRALPELLRPRRHPSSRRPPPAAVDVEAVLGAALFVRRRAVREVGELDEGYFFFLEETDWCWRMGRAGWRVVFVPDARAVHESGASSKRRPGLAAATRIEFHRSLYRFVERTRGPRAARFVAGWRFLRALGTALLLAVPALFAGRPRRRLAERAALLRWHLRGRPAGEGLSGVAGRPGAR